MTSLPTGVAAIPADGNATTQTTPQASNGQPQAAQTAAAPADIPAAEPASDQVGRSSDVRALVQFLTRDNFGALIVRNEVLAVSPSSASLAIARGLNFTVESQDVFGALGLSSVTLKTPDGMSTIDALALLRRSDPQGTYDFAHIYNPMGELAMPVQGPLIPISFSPATGLRIGMIDGGVGRGHPAFANAKILVANFARTSVSPATLHGTAIASLLVGQERDFGGYAAGATLYAADVFGGAADGGSAQNIVRALNWMVANKVAVINISLAGPPNALLAAAVKAFVAKGHVLVAAVGNDGPAAPPNFPAAYPGVIAVTSVDSNRQVQFDANRGAQFAALGVNVRAAVLPTGYSGFTGTSYAAPLVAARVAHVVSTPVPDAYKRAVADLSLHAVPLDPGAGLIYVVAPGLDAAVTASVRN